MLVATLLWSMAGVVTRQLDGARSFEVDLLAQLLQRAARWSSLLARAARRRPRWRDAARAAAGRCGSRALCWSVMFTAFMVAMTMTTVANVLVTMAIAPLLTALIARFALGQRLPPRTWAAIVVAGAGIAWMYANEVAAPIARHLLGSVGRARRCRSPPRSTGP